MAHDHGMFVNDLFNGEALSGPHHEGDRGIFRVNLFDGEPLGRTTPGLGQSITDALTEATTSTVAPHTATPLPSAKGGGSAVTPYAPPSGGGKDSSGGGASTYTPYGSPSPDASSYGSTGTDWTPWLIGGGVVVVAIGIVAVMASSRKPAPAVTANKRRRARRNRKAHRRAR